MTAERPTPAGSSRRCARAARRIGALAVLPLCLMLLPASASANLVVRSSPGVGGTNVDLYEYASPDNYADRIEIRQDLGPTTLTFEITAGDTVINFEGGEPCMGGFGAQTMTCTFPNDVVRLDVDPGEHNDRVVSSAPVDTFWDGGPGRDELTGGPAADVMEGGTTAPPVGTTLQHDTLNGGPGPDELYGQVGNDALNGGPGADLVDGHTGDDAVTGEAGPDLLFGGDGSDVLSGGDGRDEFNGGAGSDVATYAGRSDPIDVKLDGLPNDGGAGDDNADNVLPGIETLIAGEGDDRLRSSSGGGTIEIEGGGGNDVILGGPGNDHFSGDEGNDRIVLAEGSNTAEGGDGGDVIIGGGGNELFLAGPGNDVLLGAGGDDNLNGEEGDDQIDGGPGADLANGSAGTDSVTYAGRISPVVVTIDEIANDGGSEDLHNDNVFDVEAVIGGTGDDTLAGSDAGEQLRGGPGSDTVAGGGGVDRLFGDAGNDALVGGRGADDLLGLGGNDTLNARDSAADARIDCGTGVDRGLTDASDPPSVGCEESPPPPPPPPPPGATPLGKVAGKKVPVKLAATGRARAGVKATARPRLKCPTTATATCAGRVVLKAQKKRPGGGKKLIKLGVTDYALEPGTRQRIAVKVKKKARKLIARKRRTKGKASLAGERTQTKKVTFVRKR